MSEEKAVYRVNGKEGQVKKSYDDMESMDEIITYYGIDSNQGYKKDFKNPSIQNAVDDLIRVINSYEKHPNDQQGYRLTKMKNALHSLMSADKKLR